MYRPLILLSVVISFNVLAQARIGQGEIKDIYQEYCASCHGVNLEGGMGSSLVDDVWKYGDSDEAISNVIRLGKPELSMPAWQSTLSAEQIRAMVVFIREQTFLYKEKQLTQSLKPNAGVFKSNHYQFSLSEVERVEQTIWGLSFTPTGDMLITEKQGRLWFKANKAGAEKQVIKNTPEIWLRGQGGLLDVAAHPNYAENGWIYLAYAQEKGGEENNKPAGMTAIVRGQIKQGEWVNQQTIYSSDNTLHTSAGAHFGSRIVFRNNQIYFSIGDRGRSAQSQDLTRPNGKIHRLNDDGSLPGDNPFLATTDALPSIYSYGHRNPQGLALHPETNVIWSTEHGPRGGDEINIINSSVNYGWPKITYGINYNGKPITDKTAQAGMEQPKRYYVPSIAPAGIEFYSGTKFSKWQHNLLITGMSSQELRRLVIKNNEIIDEEILIKNQGRIRDVAVSPTGDIYVAINQKNKMKGRVLRLSF